MDLQELFEKLLLIRRTEETVSSLFADGLIPGFIHLSIGQEAVPVGVISHLTERDTLTSTHRGHGHAIAKGLSVVGFFSELLGKEEGLCRGRGGSMHVADLSIGILGANGIVGAGIPIAMGSAIAHKAFGRDAIAVAFFGDGAVAEGVLHETLNMAKLLQLPVLFVCENNGWSEFSPTERQVSFALKDLSGAYKIPYSRTNGNDVVEVHETAGPVIHGVRGGTGPAVLECITARVHGHYEGDAQKYRSAAEIAMLPTLDPIRILKEKMLSAGFDNVDLEEVHKKVEARIAEAVSTARRGKDPDFNAARADVYTPKGAH